jgi:hypothetical protein
MIRQIPLTQGRVALVDDADYAWLSQWKWCYADNGNGKGYAIRYEYTGGKPRRIAMHRLIMSAPQNMKVDHQDGDGLNNTRSNLRLCTNTQNLHNKRKQQNTSSRYKGVYLFRNRWTARISVNKKLIFPGQFDTEEQAAQTYDAAASKHFGAFARLNFPNNPAIGAVTPAYPMLDRLTWLELANA